MRGVVVQRRSISEPGFSTAVPLTSPFACFASAAETAGSQVQQGGLTLPGFSGWTQPHADSHTSPSLPSTLTPTSSSSSPHGAKPHAHRLSSACSSSAWSSNGSGQLGRVATMRSSSAGGCVNSRVLLLSTCLASGSLGHEVYLAEMPDGQHVAVKTSPAPPSLHHHHHHHHHHRLCPHTPPQSTPRQQPLKGDHTSPSPPQLRLAHLSLCASTSSSSPSSSSAHRPLQPGPSSSPHHNDDDLICACPSASTHHLRIRACPTPPVPTPAVGSPTRPSLLKNCPSSPVPTPTAARSPTRPSLLSRFIARQQQQVVAALEGLSDCQAAWLSGCQTDRPDGEAVEAVEGQGLLQCGGLTSSHHILSIDGAMMNSPPTRHPPCDKLVRCHGREEGEDSCEGPSDETEHSHDPSNEAENSQDPYNGAAAAAEAEAEADASEWCSVGSSLCSTSSTSSSTSSSAGGLNHEASIAALLAAHPHPNIVQYLGTAELEGEGEGCDGCSSYSPALVMELCEGGTLLKLIRAAHRAGREGGGARAAQQAAAAARRKSASSPLLSRKDLQEGASSPQVVDRKEPSLMMGSAAIAAVSPRSSSSEVGTRGCCTPSHDPLSHDITAVQHGHHSSRCTPYRMTPQEQVVPSGADGGAVDRGTRACAAAQQRPLITHPSAVVAALAPRFFGSWRLRVDVLRGVARGLAHMHSLGVVHGDVTSYNVLLSKGCEPKLSDFDHAHATRAPIVRTGAPHSLLWQPAEHVLGCGPYDGAAADVHCFGILMFEVVTLCVPHTAREDEAHEWDPCQLAAHSVGRLCDHQHPPYRDPLEHFPHHATQLWPSLPASLSAEVQAGVCEGLVRVVRQCCDPMPNARPGMGQVVAQLDAIAGLLSAPLIISAHAPCSR